MAINLNILSIPLNGTGTEIPTLNVTDPFEKYVLTGTATATGNYAIVPTGTPQQGTTFIFKYKATLDITTNSKTFSIFGQALTQNQLTSDLDIEAYYDNAAWIVEVKPSFTSAVVEAANLIANSVGTTQIANGAVTEPKLATNSVSTNKIVNLAVTTGKIADLAVTNAKINDVNGSKIVDDTVTNAKLATMSNSSVKIGGATGDPTDLVLAANEVPMGNGTTIVAVNKSTLVSPKAIISITLPISFESGLQTVNKTCWFPPSGTYYLSSVLINVTKAIAGTDDAQIDVAFDGQADILFDSPTFNSNIIIPASTAIGTAILFTNTASSGANRINAVAIAKLLNLTASKATPGGTVTATIILHEL